MRMYVTVHQDPFPCAAVVFKTRLLGLVNFLTDKMGPFFQYQSLVTPPLGWLNAQKQREWHGRGSNTFPKEDFFPNKPQV